MLALSVLAQKIKGQGQLKCEAFKCNGQKIVNVFRSAFDVSIVDLLNVGKCTLVQLRLIKTQIGHQKLTKGQLISKCLFVVFNFSQKNERKQVALRYHSSKVEFFCSFFGRIEDYQKVPLKLTDLQYLELYLLIKYSFFHSFLSFF